MFIGKIAIILSAFSSLFAFSDFENEKFDDIEIGKPKSFVEKDFVNYYDDGIVLTHTFNYSGNEYCIDFFQDKTTGIGFEYEIYEHQSDTKRAISDTLKKSIINDSVIDMQYLRDKFLAFFLNSSFFVCGDSFVVLDDYMLQNFLFNGTQYQVKVSYDTILSNKITIYNMRKNVVASRDEQYDILNERAIDITFLKETFRLLKILKHKYYD